MHTPSEDLRQLCKWFRVLTIGRGIAGKPTILERMTGRSRGQPEIRGKEGRLVLRASVISLILTVKAGLEVRQVNKCLHLFSHPLPKFKRGMSVIDYEITYPSSPHFIFRFSRDRSWSRIRLSWYGSWRRTRVKQVSYRVYSEVHQQSGSADAHYRSASGSDSCNALDHIFRIYCI